MDPTKDQTDQPTIAPNNQDVVPPPSPSVGGLAKEAGQLGRVEDSVTAKGPEVTPELKDLKVEASTFPHDQIKLTEQISHQPTAAASSTVPTIIE
mgnify:CR=1 FL=1